MSLESILRNYKTERYKLFSDVLNNTKVSGILGFSSYLDYFDNYLGYYKTIDDTEKLVTHAVKGIFEYKGKTYIHPNQKIYKDRGGNDRGIPENVSNEVIENILNNINKLERALNKKDFNSLYEFIKEYKMTKFSGAEIYDTALRIGSKYDIAPNEVYLHGGSLMGLKALETKKLVEEDLSLNKTVKVSELPECFKGMKPEHVEDFLNLRKGDLMRI